MMRRTKFNNVVDLGTARKARKAKKRKDERRRKKVQRNYRVGVLLKVDLAKLTPMELNLCAMFREADRMPNSATKALYELIGKIMLEQNGAVHPHVYELDGADEDSDHAS